MKRLFAPIAPGATPWLELVCLVLFGLTPLFGYLGYLGLAPLVGLAGLFAAPTLAKSRPRDAPAILLAILCLWAAVSLNWSPAAPLPGPDGDYGGVEKLTLVKLILELGFYGAAVAAFGRMAPASARRAATVLAIGLAPMAAIYICDAIQKGAILQAIGEAMGDKPEPQFSVKNAAQTGYVLAMLIFPALMVAVRRGWRGLAIGLAAALVIGTVITDYTSPLLAFIMGGLAWFCVRRWGAVAARVMIAPVVIGYLAAPFVVLLSVRTGFFAVLHKIMPLSWDIRLDIWAFAASKIVENPLRGHGLDAARTYPGAIPLHTHDAPIQLWLELGLPGAALAAAFFAWMYWRIGDLAHERRDQAAIAAATLTSFVTVGAISFGVWQEWWIALGALALIFCRVERRGWNDAVKAWAQDDLAPLPN